MYLLDNNVISEMRKIKINKADENVKLWFESIDLHTLYTCQIVMMELERGVLLKQRKDKPQGKMLANWFYHSVKPLFHGRIFTLNDEISHICAKFHTPNLGPENDCWIASTAKYYDMTLVTRNVKDFENLPIKLLNPFESNLK